MVFDDGPMPEHMNPEREPALHFIDECNRLTQQIATLQAELDTVREERDKIKMSDLSRDTARRLVEVHDRRR